MTCSFVKHGPGMLTLKGGHRAKKITHHQKKCWPSIDCLIHDYGIWNISVAFCKHYNTLAVECGLGHFLGFILSSNDFSTVIAERQDLAFQADLSVPSIEKVDSIGLTCSL